jgi:hypothetical protein
MPCRRTSIVSLPAPNSKPGGAFITRKGTAKDGDSVLVGVLRSTNLRDQTTGSSACGICTRQPSPLRPMVLVKPEGLDHTGLHLRLDDRTNERLRYESQARASGS